MNNNKKEELKFLKNSFWYKFMGDDSENVIMWRKTDTEQSRFVLQVDISESSKSTETEMILPTVYVNLKNGVENIFSKLDFESKNIETQICNAVDEVIFNLLLKNSNDENIYDISGKFDCSFIRKCIEDIRKNSQKIISQLYFQGQDAYIMLVNEQQASSLIKDPEWKHSRSPQDTYGMDSKIFENALGVYWGVIVYKCEYLSKINANKQNSNGSRALLLGRQAVLFAISDELLMKDGNLDFNKIREKGIENLLGIETAHYPNNKHTFGAIHLIGK